MTLLFDINLSYASIEALELSNEAFMEKVIDTFKNDENFKTLNYFGSGKKLRKIQNATPAQVVEKIAAQKRICLCDSSNSDSNDDLYKFTVEFSLRNTIARIWVFINKVDVAQTTNNIALLLSSMDKFLKLFENKIELDLVSHIRYPYIDYPKIKPPRHTGQYSINSIVDLINPEELEFEDERKITTNLCFNELPSTVTRKKIGKYYCIDWFSKSKVESEIELQKILTEKERWFYDNSDFKLSCYNELGDELAGLWGAKPTEYLTFYSAFNAKGLKATVLNPDGSYDQEIFEDMKAWLKKEETPDGKKINDIGLIFPDRESCLKIKPIADEFGFYKVLYPMNNGDLLNPFPEGLWAE